MKQKKRKVKGCMAGLDEFEWQISILDLNNQASGPIGIALCI